MHLLTDLIEELWFSYPIDRWFHRLKKRDVERVYFEEYKLHLDDLWSIQNRSCNDWVQYQQKIQHLSFLIHQEFGPIVSFFPLYYRRKDHQINPSDLLKNNKISIILFVVLELNGRRYIPNPSGEGNSLSIICSCRCIEGIQFVFLIFSNHYLIELGKPHRRFRTL